MVSSIEWLPCDEEVDLSPFSNLKVLTAGDEDNVKYVDLEKLPSSLEEISLTQNVMCLDFLERLINVKEVDLGNQVHVKSLLPLGSLHNLKKFYMWHSKVSDLTPVYDLYNLEYLDLSYSRVLIVDDEVEEMVSLKTFILDFNAVKHISSKIETVPLEFLSIASNELVQLPSLPVTLERLDCENNYIESFCGIEHCRLLTTVDASSNCIEDIEEIRYCPKIEYLCLSNNKITFVDSFAAKDLTYLNMSGNEIECAEFTAKMFKLKVLILGNNFINDVKFSK